MKKLGFVYHDDFLKHDTGVGHPERKERLEAVVRHLGNTGMWEKMEHILPTAASVEWISTAHTQEYIRWVERQCERGKSLLDSGDTHVCSESYDVALLAAGAVLQAIDRVMTRQLSSVFCAVRPPGHHAEPATAMGFCLFNNIAIGARYAQAKYSVERVAIVDWDVHHGNGTQKIFYEDPSVLYISLHQFPLWPGTGAAGEIGEGKGKGFTLNCPMKPGSGDREYDQAFAETILPALRKFQPQLLMISAGFDAHRDDPLANIQLTDQSFGTMTALMREFSENNCEGRIVSVLEGGYNLEALAKSIEVHLRTLSS